MATAYVQALTAVQQDPTTAARACASVDHADLRADCVSTAAELLAPSQAEQAAALCTDLPEGTGRDECHFQVAERSGDARRCDAAGAFRDDCRLHRLSTDLRGLIPSTAAPGDFEADLAAALPRYGLDPLDPRPWSAAYRWVLGRQRPLDRGSCGAAPQSFQVDACMHTALALFHDRLNHARDRGQIACDGQPLTGSLAFIADSELQAALDERLAEDLCP